MQAVPKEDKGVYLAQVELKGSHFKTKAMSPRFAMAIIAD